MGRLLVPLILAALLTGCNNGREETAPTATSGEAPATTSGTTTRKGPSLASLSFDPVASGLDSPVGLSTTPAEPGRLYVVEQSGAVRVLENGEVTGEPFLDVTSEVRSGGEQGLLSLAFHPDYASNGLFYVDYTDTNGDTRVVEFQARAGSAPVRKRELLFVDQPYANHNGGQLAFGPDGRLYVGMGDGGSGGDPENRAQDLSQRLGKLLSIDVDEPGAEWRIEGYGLRNPWRFSFDRETGDLWLADVGQGEWEEIDHTPRESPGLENYGWDVYEGTHSYEDKALNADGRLVMPVYEYSHDEGCSVTGGFVYRGGQIPAARGRYFFGDYCSGTVWSLALRNGKATDVRSHGKVDALTAFAEDERGELYAASQNGEVLELAGG